MFQTAIPRVQSWWTPRSPLTATALACVVASAVGLLAAATNPFATVAGIVGAVTLSLVLARPFFGLLALLAVLATLPFGVIPLNIGVQLTFVDAVLISTFLGFLLRLPFAGSASKRWRTAHGLMVVYLVVVIAAFAAGSGYDPTSADLFRRFGKLAASLALFLVASSLVETAGALRWLTRGLILVGAIAGAIATVLWLLPPQLQEHLLVSLQPLGYPATNVLRYVPGANETYTSQLRATGTAVDPNVLGGTLALALVLASGQLAAPRGVCPRPVLLAMLLPTASGLLVSFSRAGWIGAAAGILLLGSLRYRRLSLGALATLAVLLALPIGQDALARFTGGLSATDPATALRLGEYRNALTLIQRYPMLGIGFGASPDIDVSAGVSSVYLLVAEQSGLLGLGAFLATLVAVLTAGYGALRSGPDEQTRGLVSAYLAATVGALVAGLFDHYFANQVFPHAVALFWLYPAGVMAAARLAADRSPER